MFRFYIIIFLLLFQKETNAFSLSYEFVPKGWFTSVRVITVDPKEHQIILVRAKADNPSLETVPSMARRYNAKAAVNGGFFQANGRPVGILKIANQWHSTPTYPRGAIGWSDGGTQVVIDQVLTNNSSDPIQITPQSKPPHTVAADWSGTEHIVGGIPLLLRGGQLIEGYASEKASSLFLDMRHSRTAIGILENGHWVFVAVSSRLFGLLGGMTVPELAEFMLSLGCREALNLDGGTSTTMVLGGRVLNRPDGEVSEGNRNVRAVSNAILILPRE